jgi:hypothetical protein
MVRLVFVGSNMLTEIWNTKKYTFQQYESRLIAYPANSTFIVSTQLLSAGACNYAIYECIFIIGERSGLFLSEYSSRPFVNEGIKSL